MKWFYLFIVILGLLFVGGCTIPTPCAPADMGVPINMHPSGFAIVPLSPSLTWEYPPTVPSPYPYPSGTGDCAISGYQIYVAPFNDSDNNLGGSVSGASTNSFTPGAPLAPATIYFWEARAVSASGPGPWSGKHAFVTGPVCEAASLTAPYAHSPMGTINTLTPTFIWFRGYSPPTSCTPEGYHFELSMDPGFGSTVASFDTSVDPSSAWKGWTPDSDLLDCTNYYWRVATRNASSVGPYSNQSFRTQVGLCLLPFYFIPFEAANCRIGPNPLYDRVSVLTRGVQYPVEARHLTADGLWFDLRLPNDLTCWVSEVTGEFQGDPNGLPEGTGIPSLPQKPEGGEGAPPPPCIPSPTNGFCK